MHAHCSYEYAVIRVVPRVEQEEFVNVGVIAWFAAKDLLQVRFDLQETRVLAIDPGADLEAIHKHLDGIVTICDGGQAAGAIGKLSKRERFGWLIAPRSTIIQTSAVHSGRCTDFPATLEHLLNRMVRPIRGSSS